MKPQLILLFIYLMLLNVNTFAINTNKIDSLEKIISNIPEKIRSSKLIELASKCLYNSPQKSIYLSKKAYELATKSDNQIERIEAIRTIGVAFFIQDKYDEALKYYLQALEISKQINDKSQIAVNLMNIGSLYSSWKKYSVALKYYEEALEILKKNNENKGLTKVYNNIGMINLICGNYNDALKYFDNSIKISTMLKDSFGIAHTLDNIGIVYSKKEDYTLALLSMEKSLSISERVSDDHGAALTMTDIGEVYMKRKMYEKALVYFEKSLFILKKINDKSAQKICYENILQLYFLNNGNDKFLEYFKFYTAISDSLTQEENSKQLAELQVKYETEKKDDEINILSKEQKIQNLELSKQKNFRNYLIILVLLVTILVFAVYNRYLIKKRSETNLQILNQTKNKFFSIISHDLRGPINALLAITERLTIKSGQMTKDEVYNTSSKVFKSLESLNILLENLLNWSLSQIGSTQFHLTSQKLADLVAQQVSPIITNEKKIHLTWDIREDIYVDADNNVIKTVLRNLLNNAYKFTGEGGFIKIYVIEKNSHYEVCVEDNGIGILPEDTQKLFRIDIKHTTDGTAKEKGTGLGLVLCKELLQKTNENIWVESVSDRGSIFKFTLKKSITNSVH